MFIKTIYSIGLLFITCYLIRNYICNFKTRGKYKREYQDNNIKYRAQRCYEDAYKQYVTVGDENKDDDNRKNGRDYIYLVNEKDKKYYRIVDLYTLDQLGYPRPPRSNIESFHSDGYSLGQEIKIFNIISDIKVALNIQDKYK